MAERLLKWHRVLFWESASVSTRAGVSDCATALTNTSHFTPWCLSAGRLHQNTACESTPRMDRFPCVIPGWLLGRWALVTDPCEKSKCYRRDFYSLPQILPLGRMNKIKLTQRILHFNQMLSQNQPQTKQTLQVSSVHFHRAPRAQPCLSCGAIKHKAFKSNYWQQEWRAGNRLRSN